MSKQLFPLVMADVALFCLDEEQRLRLLVTQRAQAPAQGDWALPGGLLKPSQDGSMEDTARRVLREKVGLDAVPLEQVRVFSGDRRDERGWSLSVLYLALLPKDQVPAVAMHKTDAVAWIDPGSPGVELAFDHASMVQAALQALRAKVRDRKLPLHLLNPLFTLTELQRACEAVLDTTMDKAAFRRRLKEREGIDFEAVEGEKNRGRQRPAQCYRATQGFCF